MYFEMMEEKKMYDVVIIGAGVSGTASARALSAYDLKICVVEKAEDVCCGTSKANSAIVHAGYDAKPGSLMAKLNVRGNKMMPQVVKDLDVPFNPCGSLVVCREEEDEGLLQELYDQGIANGVEGLKILNKEEAHAMEPNLADDVKAALWAPSAGVICPFLLNIAYAENACENGAEFRFDTEVQEIERIDGGYRLITDSGLLETKVVVNAAGVHADQFHNMVSGDSIHITPRRGDYCLLDKTAGNLVSRTISSFPENTARECWCLRRSMEISSWVPQPSSRKTENQRLRPGRGSTR